jgi:hypothetical protein
MHLLLPSRRPVSGTQPLVFYLSPEVLPIVMLQANNRARDTRQC